MDKAALFRQFDFFGNLSNSTQEQIISFSKEVPKESGQYLFHMGEICQNAAFVINGEIRVFRISDSGREVTLYHVEKGQACMLNLVGILSGQPIHATAQAVKRSSVITIPGFAFREWVIQEAFLQKFVFELISKRLNEVMDLISELVFQRMEDRLVNFLINQFLNGDTIHMTHDQIAAELGTAREVVSRLLQALVLKGVLETGRSQIRLKDFTLLKSLPEIQNR